MTDEKYTFISDVREKRQTGRSSHNRKPHAGRGGRVRLQSDNLTIKELLALNGETKSYRMNDPMKWHEFNDLPDDLKVDYIRLIREKFKAPNAAIANMLGVSNTLASKEFLRAGCAASKMKGQQKWDKEGFEAWAYGKHEEQTAPAEEAREPVVEIRPMRAVPDGGSMSFVGKPAEVLETVWRLLGNGKAHITIAWELMDEEGANDEN